MDEDRPRRMAVLVLLCGVFLVTSWIEDFSRMAAGGAADTAAGKGVAAGAGGKMSGRKVARPLEDVEGGKERKGAGGRKGDYTAAHEEEEEDEESDMPDYIKKFKDKSRLYVRTSLQLDLYSCLPRFICELHAQAPGADLTDFEKDVLNLFRNHVVLEGPSSPAYSYQIAAHMGQLWAGVEPSPCHSMYPSCPLSRTLLIDLLRNIKTSRRMFY
ncbi:uncharacterized protein LOC126983543 [Eriocheir sinensis]|uniref:uncharacterized protein LOC126983543 n=1 Tax=Eriocheir sinensis TaxID=95602 RepID=UPI0021C8244B|nr:uncharacterized protein LOC126983543 [Eriocheir sinensis]